MEEYKSVIVFCFVVWSVIGIPVVLWVEKRLTGMTIREMCSRESSEHAQLIARSSVAMVAIIGWPAVLIWYLFRRQRKNGL